VEDRNHSFAITVIWIALFVVFTIMVGSYDLQPIGPSGSYVGFAELNDIVRIVIGQNEKLYDISKYIAAFSLFLGCIFALVGLVQWIKRKNIAKVDYRILLLGGCYLEMALLYFIFLKAAVNYRPVIWEGEKALEASYPSSHTMLALVIFCTAVEQFRYMFKSNFLKGFCGMIVYILAFAMVMARFLSGCHWFTDIIGSILLSSALISLYKSSICYIYKARKRKAAAAAAKAVSE